MLACLQQLHAAGFTHNDVKPSNFCCELDAAEALPAGRGAAAGAAVVAATAGSRRLRLVDFGISHPITTRDGSRDCGSACSTGSGMPLGATPLFASIAAHEGTRVLEPADDLQSLCFSLVYLAGGSLPWEHADDERAVFEAKREMSAARLTEGLSHELAEPIGRLWEMARQGRGLHSAVPSAAPSAASRTEHFSAKASSECYALHASWPASCRATLGEEAEDCSAATAPQLDWEAAGITWTPLGQIAYRGSIYQRREVSGV